jgi:hypothetical protein
MSASITTPARWDPEKVLSFKPSNFCCGSMTKGGICFKPLHPKSDQPNQTLEGIQIGIVKQLAALDLRPRIATPLLMKLARASLCDEHYNRQMDRFLRRWERNLDAEIKRRSRGLPHSPPSSVRPSPPGESAGTIGSTTRQVSLSAPHHQNSPPSSNQNRPQLSTPQIAISKYPLPIRPRKEPTSVNTQLSIGKCGGSLPSINAHIATPRTFLSRGKAKASESLEFNSRYPTPSPSPFVHAPTSGTTRNGNDDLSAPIPSSKLLYRSLDSGPSSAVSHEALDEIRRLHKNIMANHQNIMANHQKIVANHQKVMANHQKIFTDQQKIFKDQARIIELLLEPQNSST